jgi:hypothetical protein
MEKGKEKDMEMKIYKRCVQYSIDKCDIYTLLNIYWNFRK